MCNQGPNLPYLRKMYKKHLMKNKRNYGKIMIFKFDTCVNTPQNMLEHFLKMFDCRRFLIRRCPLYSYMSGNSQCSRLFYHSLILVLGGPPNKLWIKLLYGHKVQCVSSMGSTPLNLWIREKLVWFSQNTASLIPPPCPPLSS